MCLRVVCHPAQAGYLPNHNMDPSIISSGGFGRIWTYSTPTGASEQFYAKPLVFTPLTTGRQIVLSFSEQNRIYALDAVNGTLLATRDLALDGEGPFAVSDLGQCNDISGTIGVTGTPVIDPATDTVYFWAKSYISTVKGFQNGAYRFHAIDAVTLQEKAGFPKSIQGTPADNDVSRIFIGGTVLQRPALNIVNGIVFAGFGGHCDQYNFTGWVVGMQTNTGKLMTAFATVGGPGSPAPATAQDVTYNSGGGGAAIWMGGSAIASDQAGRIFFATGNGQKGGQNQGQPASGRLKLNTMNEAVVNMAVNPSTGLVTQSDYFEPYTYSALDNADRDLGSGGIALLDPNTFNGNGVSRIAVTVGKNGVCYVFNADNLGGYKLGTGGTDAILQTITMPGSGPVFGNPGSYPLEGGYMYITPVGYPTLVYSYGKTSTGSPAFTLVAQSADISAGRVGTGSATITTYKGQPGTAILWVVDPDAGLRAYNAVPSNGQLTKLPLPPTPSVSKFQRPAFGDGRYYMSTSNGKILAYGSPVALPMTCDSPLDFGQAPIGNTKTLIVTCKTNIAITSLNGFATNKPVFQVSNSSLPTGPLALGATFSFPVTFNLTALILTGSTSSPSVTPGVQTSSVWISTTNGNVGFAPQQPISLTGTAISAAPFITVNPLQIDFAGVVVGSAAAETGSDATFILSNVGLSDMTILGMAWTSDAVNSDAAVFHNLTTVNGKTLLDGPGYFTSTSMPSIGQVIPAGGTMTINANFNTNVTGTYSSIVKFYTNGNTAYTLFTGSAATNPVALLEYSTNEGGWNTIAHCANLVTGCVPQINFAPSGGLTAQTIQLRLTNNGGSVLTVTKSKPLEGAELGATNPSTDFFEGQTIMPGKSALASVLFSPGAAILNADNIVYSGAWTLNTDDQTFGVHVITFNGIVTSKKTGPLTSTGQSLYKYLGCYQDYINNVRLEPKQINNVSLTNGWCQSQALSAGVVFAGTEYMTECWIGNVIPGTTLKGLDSQCGYNCGGDSTQVCGGVNGFISLYYDSSRYFPQNGTILGTSGLGPQRPNTIGAYNYAGCYSDSQVARSLIGKQTAGATISLDTCAAFCSGYNFFGVEYANECYCSNTLAATSLLKPDADCNGRCKMPSGLTLYSNATLPGSSASSSSSVLPSTSSASSTSATILTSSSSPSLTAQTSSSRTSTSARPTVTGPIPAYIDDFNYLYCATDANEDRTLVGKYMASGTMTLDICASTCSEYRYFGVEYGFECFCGDTLTATSSKATDDRCNYPCPGNTAETCGGLSGLTLYTKDFVPVVSISSTLVVATTSSSSPWATASPDAWDYLGCMNDTTTARAISGASLTNTTAMTVDMCKDFCESKNYPLAGLENLGVCFCGLAVKNGGALGQTGCTSACPGDKTQLCGGSKRLNFGTQCYCSNTISAAAPVVDDSECQVLVCPGNKLQYCSAGKRLQVYSS
ncbi:WSC domain-containing protein [Leptodontidium sp. 2 PMI_412]|nr:WSC domain-containing protein [Leptodontidium sp. 2 PMI_412]